MPQKNIVSWDTVPVTMDIPMAAQIVGLSAEYIQKLARKGRFPAYKISPKFWRVDKADLLAWAEASKASAGKSVCASG